AESVAQGVDPRDHPFETERAFFWLHRGRALAQLSGRQDDAVRALRTAERIFPTAVLRHQGVREVLAELLASARRDAVGRELRGMAYRADLQV
ncbi:MAG: XRE family transcriptional regulator, partial [Pseudonocardiaceae bacterium]